MSPFLHGAVQYLPIRMRLYNKYLASQVLAITEILSKTFYFIAQEKKYKKENAGNIIWIIDGIYCLLDACFALNKMDKYSLLDVRRKDILNSKFYSNRETERGNWSDFPRLLSEKEFINPYCTFKKTFKHWTPIKW